MICFCAVCHSRSHPALFTSATATRRAIWWTSEYRRRVTSFIATVRRFLTVWLPRIPWRFCPDFWRPLDLQLFRCARCSPNSWPQFSAGRRGKRRRRIGNEKFLAEAPRRRSECDWAKHHPRWDAAHDHWRSAKYAGHMVRGEPDRGSLDDETFSDSRLQL